MNVGSVNLARISAGEIFFRIVIVFFGVGIPLLVSCWNLILDFFRTSRHIITPSND